MPSWISVHSYLLPKRPQGRFFYLYQWLEYFKKGLEIHFTHPILESWQYVFLD